MAFRKRAVIDLARVNRVAAAVEFPDGVWRTCPWQPRELVETGLREWLRCAGAAMRDGQVIGMPSHAVDEAWHGFILCTAQYARFCDAAYGRFLHHFPEGSTPAAVAGRAGSMDDQLRRAVLAWALVAEPGETAELWDVDHRVGVEQPWGIPAERVAAVLSSVGRGAADATAQ